MSNTIDSIIRNGKGTAGSNGAWRVTCNMCNGQKEYTLWHYSTRMLVWNQTDDYTIYVIDMSLGRGSVSDQQGMNRAFRILGLPYYYSRAGGARIINLREGTAVRTAIRTLISPKFII